MMKSSFFRVISLFLVLIMLLLQMGLLISCSKEEENTGNDAGDGTSDGGEDTNGESGGNEGNEDSKPGVSDINSLYYLDTMGKPVALANFCKTASETTDAAYNVVASKTNAKFTQMVGFLWNAETLTVLAKTKNAESVSIKLGDYEETFDGIGESAMLSVPFAKTGILPQDIGQLIPLTVTISGGSDSAVFDGFAKLSDHKVSFVSDCTDLSVFKSKVTANGMNLKTTSAGAELVDGGIRLYDLFDSGNGVANTNNLLSIEGITDLDAAAEGYDAYVLEADICIKAMPVLPLGFTSNKSAYGLYFNMNKSSTANSPLFAIVNTDGGLVVVCVGDTADYYSYASIGKNIGDKFHLSATWSGSTLVIEVDGIRVAAFENCEGKRAAFKKQSINIATLRSDAIPTADDDIDVVLSSIYFACDQSEPLLEMVTDSSIFGGRTVPKIDEYIRAAAKPQLKFTENVTSEKYGISAKIYWVSDNTEVISNTGVVTSPTGSGEFVPVTAYIAMNNAIVGEKVFEFFSPGANADKYVTVVEGEEDPFTSVKLRPRDTVYAFDNGQNTLVFDMGKVGKVNKITLSSVKNIGLVNKNFISVYYSDDNVSYEMIDDFSVYQNGHNAYIYNFDVNARYIKVHLTEGSSSKTTKTIINSLQKLLFVEYTEAPLLSTGSFSGEKTVKVENKTNEVEYDKIVALTLKDIGINVTDLKEDMSDIRFMLDGLCLPHYFDGEKFNVRVFEIAANSSVQIKVLYGNKDAQSVENGEETFEIKYGTIQAKRQGSGWQNSIATMPNGDVVKIIQLKSNEANVCTNEGNGSATNHVQLAQFRSTNGGLSWTPVERISGTSHIQQGGGFIVDDGVHSSNGKVRDESGEQKVFYFAYDFNLKQDGKWTHGGDNSGKYWWCKYYIYESTDNGKTWSLVGSPTNAPEYAISYSDGIVLSTADGEGPNVDYVFTTGAMRDEDNDKYTDEGFSTTAIYSKDGGKTWIFSDSRINYTGFVGAANNIENGMSEEAVWEQDDGTLVFYARCQLKEIIHFAMSYSTNGGVTWSEIDDSDFSNVYTTNTQPIIETFDGNPILMWGGNHSLGGATYQRFPWNLAISYDDAETFVDIINGSFGTYIDTLDPAVGQMLHTNPDLTFYEYKGRIGLYMVSQDSLRVLNADEFLYKTKGAYDSFEDTALAEGWQLVYGSVGTAAVGATRGEKALVVNGNTAASRSLHYIEKGTVSFDYFVSNPGHVTFELQTAFNNKPLDEATNKTAPVSIFTDADGNLYYHKNGGKTSGTLEGLKLVEGQNSISIDFDGNTKTVKVTVNGKTASMEWDTNDNYISYFTVFTKHGAQAAIDEFRAVREK